ncbi:hypothetical protein VEx25_2228 [Vibrio antiquarius]|uniref:Transposase n=1 Tax=Vibrio antiquarius (strain Ex25) TaxID=150340 RepID=A0ABM9WSW9_VIBAE|nr:hypothetical protein VEx25_2228 [Vibrio antiquarius]
MRKKLMLKSFQQQNFLMSNLQTLAANLKSVLNAK